MRGRGLWGMVMGWLVLTCSPVLLGLAAVARAGAGLGRALWRSAVPLQYPPVLGAALAQATTAPAAARVGMFQRRQLERSRRAAHLRVAGYGTAALAR